MDVSPRGVDQRLHRRRRVRVPLYVSIEGDTYRKLIPVRSSDISAGGIAFDTSRELPIDGGSRLVLSKIGALPDEAEIHGRIVRCCRNPNTRRYSVGVAFTGLVGVSESQLVAILATLEEAEAG